MNGYEFISQFALFNVEQAMLNTALIFMCVGTKICTDQESTESYHNRLEYEKLYKLTGEDRNRMCSFCEHFRAKWKKHEVGLTSMEHFTKKEYNQVSERASTLMFDINSIFTTFMLALPHALHEEIRDKVCVFFQKTRHLKDNFPKFLDDFNATLRPHKVGKCPPASLSTVESIMGNKFLSFISLHAEQVMFNTVLLAICVDTKICTKQEQIERHNYPQFGLEKIIKFQFYFINYFFATMDFLNINYSTFPQIALFNVEQVMLNTALIYICVRTKICTDQEQIERPDYKDYEKLFNLTGYERNRMCSFCDHMKDKWKKHEGGLASMKNFTAAEYKRYHERGFMFMINLYFSIAKLMESVPHALHDEIRDKIFEFFQEASHLKDNFPKFLNDFYAAVRPHKRASCPPARLSPVISTIDNEFFLSLVLFNIEETLLNIELIQICVLTKVCTDQEQIKRLGNSNYEKIYKLTGEDRNRMCSFCEHFRGKWKKHEGGLASLKNFTRANYVETFYKALLFFRSLNNTKENFLEELPTFKTEVRSKIAEFIEEASHLKDNFPKFLSTLDVTVCPHKPTSPPVRMRLVELVTAFSRVKNKTN